MKLGSSPASRRINASIEVVDVLPWVPATPIAEVRAQIAASIAERCSTGIERRLASTTSRLLEPIAVDTHTASIPSR